MGGEIFSITALLVALNIIATMIQRTYQAGHAVGTVYWRYLHKPLRWLLIHLVALVIMLSQLAWEGAIYVYQHRQEIMSWCVIQYQLVKQSFATVYQLHLQSLLVLGTDVKLLMSNRNFNLMSTMSHLDRLMDEIRQEDMEILADIEYRNRKAMEEELDEPEQTEGTSKVLL